jgi:sulfur carrier protein
MRVRLNNKSLQLDEDKTLHQLFAQQGIAIAGCAVAVNNHIVPRSRWESTVLCEGDEISLFQAIAGG